MQEIIEVERKQQNCWDGMILLAYIHDGSDAMYIMYRYTLI